MASGLDSGLLRALMDKEGDYLRWLFTIGTSEVMRQRTDKFHHFVHIKNVDVAEFEEEIDSRPDEQWSTNAARKNISVQKETDSIVLRAAKFDTPAGLAPNQMVGFVWHIHESADTSHAQHYPKIIKFLYDFARTMNSQLSRAMLVRLTPKKKVYEHFDTGNYYLIRDRYHLVIRSPQGSKMRCMSDISIWKKGELWWFNNKVMHEAFNEGEDWRIHLIFDLLPDHLIPLMEEIKELTPYYRNKKPATAPSSLAAAVAGPNAAPANKTLPAAQQGFADAKPRETRFNPDRPNSPSRPTNDHFAEARVAFNENRFQDALNWLNGFLDTEPENFIARQFRGITLERLRRFDDAIADLEIALTIRPDDARSHALLAVAQQNKGELDKALAGFDRAIELNPKDSASLNNRGVINRDRGNLDAALADFERALAITPNSALLLTNRGTVYERSGQLHRALGDYDRAIVLDPSNRRAVALKEVIIGMQSRHGPTSAAR